MVTSSRPIRFVLFSDTHLGASYARRPGARNNLRCEDFTRNFEAVIDFAVASSADLLIHAGDLFDRSKPPEIIVYKAYEKLLQAADHLPILMLAGNHERSSFPRSLFFQHPNIYIFDQARIFNFRFAGASFCFGGFPFQKKIRSGFLSCLQATGLLQQSADFRYLCIHQSVQGAQVGPVDFTFSRGDDVINANEIPSGLSAILSGHIHRHQILPTASPVIYCGATERTSFAEVNEEKGFYEIYPTLNRLEFNKLETTPMLELTLPQGLSGQQAQNLIQNWAQEQVSEAVVRIRFEAFPGGDVLRCVNKSWLDKVFPQAKAVNVSISGGWQAKVQKTWLG